MATNDKQRSGIYCIRNVVSTRVYVGSSIDIAKRWRAHLRDLRLGIHIARAMQRSWSKHGATAFEFCILELVEPEQLIQREQHWIDTLNAACPRRGFNSSPTAGNCLGVRHSNETKAKLSAARKGKTKSLDHRKAIGAAQKGKIISPEQRAIASARTAAFFERHPEARERMREVGRRNGSASKGRVLSDAARLTFSLVRLGNERFANAARANLAAISAEARARATAKTRVLLSGRPRHDRRALTFEQAEQVRALKASGLTYDQLVERFGLDRATLHQIVSGKTYQRP